MTDETFGEKLNYTIRVNSQNRKLDLDNPSYTIEYKRQLVQASSRHMAQINERLARGEIELPITGLTTEEAKSALAFRLATRELTIIRLLGGHGIDLRRETTMYYHGAIIRYVRDNEVPIGQHVLEGDVSSNEAFWQLTELTT